MSDIMKNHANENPEETITTDSKDSHSNSKRTSPEEGGHASLKQGEHNDQSDEAGIAKKKLSGNPSFDVCFQDDYIFEILLDFFSFKEIFVHFYGLSKTYQELTKEANYLLLRKLADHFNITTGFLTSDLPANEDLCEVFKQANIDMNEARELDLKPQGFYTDSGLVGTNMWYSFHNIFDTNTTNMYGGYVFSSNKGKNNHIQFYLCVAGSGVDNPFCQKLKTEFEMAPGSKEIFVPYQKELDYEETPPTFKVPKTIEFNCKNQGYCYYADNMVLCFSASEVDNKKFQKSTKIFEDVKCVEDVENLGLPILNKDDSTKGFTAIEFDLSQKSKIMEVMDVKKFYSIPLVYLYVDKNQLYGMSPSYDIQQDVAAKYMSMKLICCSSNLGSTQLDLFPAKLKGKSLNFW